MLTSGTIVDRYVIDGHLGSGGMADVYRARHRQLGSMHAIKVLAIPRADLMDRLTLEAQAQSQLRHPNIVPVTDFLDINGIPAIVMELIDGPTLCEWLVHNRLTLEQADALARGLLRGVRAAHDAGLIHRDLKPSNILLEKQDGHIIPKITDFGLVKAHARSSSNGPMTMTGAVMGTPGYMAPEQIRDSGAVDARADLFSLGAIFFELVTGQRAFPGTDRLDVFNRTSQGQYESLDTLAPQLPEQMVQAITWALQPDLTRRVPTCGELESHWCAGDVNSDHSVWPKSGPLHPAPDTKNFSERKTSQETVVPSNSTFAAAFQSDPAGEGQDRPNPLVAERYDSLGEALLNQGQIERAGEYFMKSLVIRRAVFGEQHPDVAASLVNVGAYHLAKSENPQALDYFQQSLAIRLNISSPDHPNLSVSYNNVGIVLVAMGEYTKGLAYYHKSLEMDLKRYGEEHFSTASAYNNIGYVHHKTGRFQEALEYSIKSLEIKRRLLGEEKESVAIAYNNTGRIYLDLGEYEKALEFTQKGMKIRLALYPEDHVNIAINLTNLGAIWAKTGEYEKALDTHEKALAIRLKHFAENHHAVADSYHHIGVIFDNYLQFKKGLEYYEKALAIRLNVYGETHPDVGASYHAMGRMYDRLGHHERAIEFHEKSIAIDLMER